jgi:hypothetical protein
MNIRGRLEKLEYQKEQPITLCAVGSREGESPDESIRRAQAEKPGYMHYVYTGVPEAI